MNMPYRKFEINITRTASGETPVHIGGTSELLEHIKGYYDGVDRELVLAVILDDLNSLLGIYEVSRGGKNEVPIDASNVFRPALMLNASKVILVHNHPTGDTRPSEGDIRSAKAIFMLGSLLEMEVSDNVVVDPINWKIGSVHEEPEFRRWLQEDLLRIATLMAGTDLSVEQQLAADQLQRETAKRVEAAKAKAKAESLGRKEETA
jgi:hypothetical protein